MIHACTPSTWEVEVAGSDGEFKANMDYMRQYLITTTTNRPYLENKINMNILTLSLGRGIPLLLVLYLFGDV